MLEEISYSSIVSDVQKIVMIHVLMYTDSRCFNVSAHSCEKLMER